MGIKSTVTITRGQALEKLFEALGSKLTDEELGDICDLLEEQRCRRENETCFTNYLVGGDGRNEFGD